MTGITNGSTVLTASAPSGVYVKDFKILNDWVYFVGEGEAANTKAHVAIVGAFQIYNVFYSSGIIQYTTLHPTFSSDHSPYSALSLLRTEVYSYDGIVHIIAIGKQTEDLNGILTTAVFDITYPFLSYRTVPSIFGDKEGIFFDLALTDNYVVTVAHKGYSYDLFGNGYIMMRPFHRDNNPLASTTGINRYTSDGYIIPNGIMEATGLSGDMFALSYCEPGTTATAQGIGILQVNTSGVSSRYYSNIQATSLATAPITLLRTWFIMLTQDYCATSAMPIPLAITLWMYFPPLVLATAVCLTLI